MPANWIDIIGQMKGKGINFAPALTDADVERIESTFSFRFPPDLRAFLQTAFPQGKWFPDWRSGSEADLCDWLDIPRKGALFDIEHNDFWLTEWGPRPESLSKALQCAETLLAAAPKLIPVYGHRMMPDEPNLEGNPVFSVHQTDIIYYGHDLADYLRHDFNLPMRRPWPDNLRPIRFWDIDRFQEVRWANGSCVFDNRRATLPGS
jgi:hypothetical protein